MGRASLLTRHSLPPVFNRCEWLLQAGGPRWPWQQPFCGQASGREPCSCPGNFNTSGDLELVATEGDGADGHAPGKGLLGGSHSTVCHRTDGSVEQWTVGKEALYMRVSWYLVVRGIA
jgi:hypothetical protein